MRAEKINWLESAQTGEAVSKRSIRGIGMQFIRGIVVLLSSVILARLLNPSDFGVVATILPLVAFVQLLKDFGVSATVVQSLKLGQDEVTTYFWLQVLVGFFLGVALASSGPIWSAFYDDLRMKTLALAMGAVLFVGVLGNIHNALLRRNLLFERVMWIDVGSSVLALVVASICALSGLGYWSLLVQQAVSSVASVVGYWSVCSWRPGRVGFSKDAIKGLCFGGSLTVGQVFGYIRQNADLVLIRKFTDVIQLGYYGRSQRVMMMPTHQIMGPVMSVAFPMLSRQQEQPNYSEYFENIFRFCMAVAVPVGVFGFFFPEAVVGIILGDKWSDAVPIFQALSIVSVFYPVGRCLSVNLLVFRKVKVMIILPAISMLMSVAAYWLGIQSGVERLAFYSGFVSAVMVCIYSLVVVVLTPVKGKSLMMIAFPVVACIILGVLSAKFLVKWLFFAPYTLSHHFAEAIVFGFVYSIALLFLAGYWKRMVGLNGFMRSR